MGGSRLGSIVAGILLGFILGSIFYIIPCKNLVCGPIVDSSSILIPQQLQNEVLIKTFRNGSLAGAIIGFVFGAFIELDSKRGTLTMTIASVSWLVTTIMAFLQEGHNLAHMGSGRIAFTIFMVFISLVIAIPLSVMLSFIEKLKGGSDE